METADKHMAPILAALSVAMAPHFFRLPLWITLWCIFGWSYVFLSARKRLPLPGGRLRLLLTVIGLGGVLLSSHGYRFGGDAYLGVLAVMAGLKPMEIRDHRDRVIAVFLAYFLVITSLLAYESLAMILYMFLSVAITTAVLIHTHQPSGKLSDHLRLSLRIIGQALPLMILLFFLFPRFHGISWGVHGAAGVTGFSDQLSPGDITSLVTNGDVAFRAEFFGAVPEAEKLYWRGAVFRDFDGRAWHRGRAVPERVHPVAGDRAVDYAVILEPRNSIWRFALEMPSTVEGDARIRADHTLRGRHRSRHRSRYRVKSYLTFQTGRLGFWEADALRLPSGRNPRTIALARGWRHRLKTDRQIADAALAWFRNSSFSYSLEPPALGSEPVDDFLFRTRTGYCGHFASAFAVLMRAAGIPARVVGGYLGGERNPFGNYLTVRQSDAHAWVEVFLKDRGWVRVDPTSAVAPARVEEGAAAALSPQEAARLMSGQWNGLRARWWMTLRYGWEAAGTWWDLWFSGYSRSDQARLFSGIGLGYDTGRSLLLACMLMLVLVAAFAAVYVIRAGRKAVMDDPVQREYLAFCRKLSRVGIFRPPGQGPAAFGREAAARRPDRCHEIEAIVDAYIQLRYGPAPDPDMQKRLRKMVRRFNPEV